MKYNNSITTADGIVLSIDNIVVDFTIKKQFLQKFLDYLSHMETTSGDFDLNWWKKTGIGNFCYQFKVKLPDGNSFWIGVGLNMAAGVENRIRIEANPNKVGDSVAFCEIMYFLLRHIKRKDMITVKRFDLAADLPIDRADVFLIKNGHMYSERRHGQEWTQYLGKVNTHGRVKLYNKQVEAKLTYPLTRLEMTLDPSVPYENIPFPQVYYYDGRSASLEERQHLTDTDLFILQALLVGAGKVEQLGRRKREQMQRVLESYTKPLFISENDYYAVWAQLASWTNKMEVLKRLSIAKQKKGKITYEVLPF